MPHDVLAAAHEPGKLAGALGLPRRHLHQRCLCRRLARPLSRPECRIANRIVRLGTGRRQLPQDARVLLEHPAAAGDLLAATLVRAEVADVDAASRAADHDVARALDLAARLGPAAEPAQHRSQVVVALDDIGVLGVERLLADRERLLVQPQGCLGAALGEYHPGQPVQRLRHIGMGRPQPRTADLDGLAQLRRRFVQQFRLTGELRPVEQGDRQVVPRRADALVILAEGLAQHVGGAPELGLSLGEIGLGLIRPLLVARPLAEVLVQPAEIVVALREVGVGGRVAGSRDRLADRQRAPVERLRLLVEALTPVQAGDVVQYPRHLLMLGTAGRLDQPERAHVQRLRLVVLAELDMDERNIVHVLGGLESLAARLGPVDRQRPLEALFRLLKIVSAKMQQGEIILDLGVEGARRRLRPSRDGLQAFEVIGLGLSQPAELHQQARALVAHAHDVRIVRWQATLHHLEHLVERSHRAGEAALLLHLLCMGINRPAERLQRRLVFRRCGAVLRE